MSFGTLASQVEYARLQGLGVEFTAPPQAMGPVTVATLNDTCGNLIQIAQMNAAGQIREGRARPVVGTVQLP